MAQKGRLFGSHAYYESNGWKMGLESHEELEGCSIGWISRDSEQQPNKPAPGNTSRSAADVYADIFKGVI